MCHSLQLVSGMKAGHKSEGGKEEDRGRERGEGGEAEGGAESPERVRRLNTVH